MRPVGVRVWFTGSAMASAGKLLVIAALAALVAAGLPSTARAEEPRPPELPEGFTDGVPVGAEEATSERGRAGSAAASSSSTQQRYVGRVQLEAIAAAAKAVSPACSITETGRQQLVLAPVFKESSAATTAASAPAPMTLSRYDEWNGTFSTSSNTSANYGLYAFRDPYTAYGRAYWHPGIGLWQYDSAGVGAPFTAVERMDAEIMAADVARGMVARYCNPSQWFSQPFTDQERRFAAWQPWGLPCESCEGFFQEMNTSNPRMSNIIPVEGIDRLGGVEERQCGDGGSTTFRCWYVDPSVGTIQGATGWATTSPTGGDGPTTQPAPLSLAFYVVDRGDTEVRHWMRADTGYGIDISASRVIGQNARPRTNQPLSGLTWQGGSDLCDVTAMRGACVPAPPAGMTATTLSIQGSYRAITLDANGDGRDDVLWYAPGSAADSLWLGQGGGGFSHHPVTVNGDYPFVIRADLDGDGDDDVLWYTPSGAAAQLWWSDGTGGFVHDQRIVGSGLHPFAVDRDLDVADEVFWYGPGPVADRMWEWTGSDFVVESTSVSGRYVPRVGDFDANGVEDVLWEATDAGVDSVWLHRQAGGYVSIVGSGPAATTSWVGDLDGDGFDDILWYAPGPDGDAVWFGAPGGAFVVQSFAVSGTYQPIVADLAGDDHDGDDHDDVLWFAPGSAPDFLWSWSSARQVTDQPLSVSTDHVPVVGAFSAGGADGVLWYAAGRAPDTLWWR